MRFKSFLADSDRTDIHKTLERIPKGHRDFISKYSIAFQGGCTLKGDDKHIGEVDDVKKKIVVAAPWRYSREMCLLHEVGHLVWGKFVSEKQKEQWKDLCKKTKMDKEDRQEPEELFCQAYGATYSKRPPTTFYKPEWVRFVKGIK